MEYVNLNDPKRFISIFFYITPSLYFSMNDISMKSPIKSRYRPIDNGIGT